MFDYLALKLLTQRLKHFCPSELNITCISFTCSSFIASSSASRSSGVADDRNRSIARTDEEEGEGRGRERRKEERDETRRQSTRQEDEIGSDERAVCHTSSDV